ncbi:MAG: hypothetical protein IPK81_01375 [Rhodospirillales bacterium]|nr:MAG: hypothetical protein IPK81_01375 [Rhodospirillales bacterium]
MAIITGGAGADTLPGTAAVDTIEAFGGADSLVSSQGADTLDGGDGFDFVDYIDDTAGVDVDIDAGTARDGWADIDRLIAIEHVRGSFLDDVIRGDEGYNYLDGEDGADTLNARYGDDGLRGGGGDDVLIGGGLFDLDDPNAFAEYDFADYRGTANGVVVDLANGTVYGGAGAGNDVLIGIESARGSSFADTFYGGSGADFEGFVGGGGDDRIHGDGVTNTRAEYWDAAGAVTIVLDAGGDGTASGAGVGTDALFDVNFFRGSSFADRFDASAFANGVGGGDFNHFQGDAGNDTVVGNGNTRIDYRSATIGVTVDLVVGSAGDGLGGVDSFHGVNQVRGSGFADTLSGGVDDDYEGFEGRGGNDRIDGRSGFDEAIYSLDGVPAAGISVDLAAGIVVGDPATSGTDTLISVEAVRGTIVDDLFDATGFAGGDGAANGPGTAVDPRFNVFEGMAGDDTVVGNGFTAISYVNAGSGVTVTFTAAGEVDRAATTAPAPTRSPGSRASSAPISTTPSSAATIRPARMSAISSTSPAMAGTTISTVATASTWPTTAGPPKAWWSTSGREAPRVAPRRVPTSSSTSRRPTVRASTTRCAAAPPRPTSSSSAAVAAT